MAEVSAFAEAGGQGVRTCRCCGLTQSVPALGRRERACCERCGTTLAHPSATRRSRSRTAAVALAALILYPFAVSLPMIRVEQLGRASDASLLEGTAELFARGHVLIGLVVLLCSIVLPPAKLLAMLGLSIGATWLHHHHRALTYTIVEWTGRWGMLDVLLVAVLVAAMKLGDVLEVTPGPGAVAFASVVVLSLIAGACFDPKAMWEGE
jgi:uncharacterized paraquat-inducible protein A